MSTLRDLVEEHTGLAGHAVEHLLRLAGDWQLLSDLSFADLLLWVPVGGGQEYLCVAQVRPTTAPTAYQDDQVGRIAVGPDVAHLATARSQGRIWREGDPVWYGDVPARHEAIPVRLPDRPEVIALVGRDTNLSTARTPSQLELNYLTTADDLAQMVADGTFPPKWHPDETTRSPRVGDGLVRLDGSGKVSYASPNAQSAYRRLGFPSHLVGEDMVMLAERLSDDPRAGADAAGRVAAALRGEAPPRREVEARGATVLMRALPLVPAGVPIGAVLLVRDVTDVRAEVRLRERALVTKDATIREIHHRVKNNLQTVAALLRLQARRVPSAEARAALEESVRRVASIAVVHETLSHTSDEVVEFDAVVDRVAVAATEVAAPESRVRIRRDGSFGPLGADIATPLVMVLNELLLNAVQHAFAAGDSGEVVVRPQRSHRGLTVTVADSGRGLPPDFRPDDRGRLGLQIVRTLVTGELRGTIDLRNREGGGAVAILTIPFGKR